VFGDRPIVVHPLGKLRAGIGEFELVVFDVPGEEASPLASPLGPHNLLELPQVDPQLFEKQNFLE